MIKKNNNLISLYTSVFKDKNLNIKYFIRNMKRQPIKLLIY